MITKTECNSKINWHLGTLECKAHDGILDDCCVMHSNTETLLEARKHYFDMLRRLLEEIEDTAERAGFVQILYVLNKYNVHFIDVDDIKRVNIDEPGVN